ncbi:hypothetical protein CsSME_00008079 [Camellia sinensis var. sinensis]
MMAETLITPNSHPDESSDPPAPPSIESLFSRKVDFDPAKKPFSGFSNGSGGFRLETLNPTTISDPRRLGGSGQGSGQSGLTGKKPDGSEFLDVGLDPELSFGITFRRIVSSCSVDMYIYVCCVFGNFCFVLFYIRFNSLLHFVLDFDWFSLLLISIHFFAVCIAFCILFQVFVFCWDWVVC